MKYESPTTLEEVVGKGIVDSAYMIHRRLGPDFSKKFMKPVLNMNCEKSI